MTGKPEAESDTLTDSSEAAENKAFRTIGEVAEELGEPQHVLRFWETKFHQIRPMTKGSGRRYYRPKDVDLLRDLKRLLRADGYTIKGVQKLIRDVGVSGLPDVGIYASGTIADAPDKPAQVVATEDYADEISRIEMTIKDLEFCCELLSRRD